MAQQTAVDLLKSEILLLEHMLPSHKDAIIKFLKQAKQVEKGQMEYMFECGRNFQLTGEGTFTQVYNETYGTE